LDAVDEVAQQARTSGRRYVEILRVPTMSVGVYVLPPGAIDLQTPHAEDEVYYVVRGRGRFRQGPDDRPVGASAVLFVPARQEHHFHSVEDELVLLVVFSPPESASP
jgi:mannose-6-phosphate isomerase-like protein (cupin superfamily)